MSLSCFQVTELDDWTTPYGKDPPDLVLNRLGVLCCITAAEVIVHTKASHYQVLCLYVSFHCQSELCTWSSYRI